MNKMLMSLGILSALLLIVADVPYIRDTYSGKTKPHRTSWFIVFGINANNFSNQIASGATSSLWLYSSGTVLVGIIALLSIKNGAGGLQIFDLACMLAAISGVVLWIVMGSPLVSILCNMAASFIALVPTFRKAWHHPETETHATWLVASIGCLVAALSVGKVDLQLLLLPIYGFVLQISLYALLTIRTRQIVR